MTSNGPMLLMTEATGRKMPCNEVIALPPVRSRGSGSRIVYVPPWVMTGRPVGGGGKELGPFQVPLRTFVGTPFMSTVEFGVNTLNRPPTVEPLAPYRRSSPLKYTFVAFVPSESFGGAATWLISNCT